MELFKKTEGVVFSPFLRFGNALNFSPNPAVLLTLSKSIWVGPMMRMIDLPFSFTVVFSAMPSASGHKSQYARQSVNSGEENGDRENSTSSSKKTGHSSLLLSLSVYNTQILKCRAKPKNSTSRELRAMAADKPET